MATQTEPNAPNLVSSLTTAIETMVGAALAVEFNRLVNEGQSEPAGRWKTYNASSGRFPFPGQDQGSIRGRNLTRRLLNRCHQAEYVLWN